MTCDDTIRFPEWLCLAEELAGIGYWRMDPATGAVDWSPNMFKLFEFPPGVAPRAEETMSRIHPDDRAAGYVGLSSSLQAGGHVSISRLMLPSGGVRIVESRTTAQHNDVGDILAIVGSVLDVTARIERELSLSAARDIAEKTANRETTYAANLSHEIRTPLMAIVGYAHLLERYDDLPASARRDAEQIARSSEMLLSVANNILGQSRATATASREGLAPVEVRRLVENVLNLFSGQATAKGVQLGYVESYGLPEYLTLHADALTQILVNLIGNAVKFTDEGSIDVMTEYNASLGRLSVTVADTGSGFDDKTRDGLFQRFSRGGHAEHISSGAGLGLAICKGLVDALGGTIEAESAPGSGTRITFVVPAAPGSPPTAAALLSSSQTRKLLVIDDHPGVLEIVARILVAAGADVETANNGEAGLLLAQTRPFDVILIDLNLPDASGFDLADAIRESNGPNAQARLFAFTAADIDASGLPKAFDGYLCKPIDPRELAALVVREDQEHSGPRFRTAPKS